MHGLVCLRLLSDGFEFTVHLAQHTVAAARDHDGIIAKRALKEHHRLEGGAKRNQGERGNYRSRYNLGLSFQSLSISERKDEL